MQKKLVLACSDDVQYQILRFIPKDLCSLDLKGFSLAHREHLGFFEHIMHLRSLMYEGAATGPCEHVKEMLYLNIHGVIGDAVTCGIIQDAICQNSDLMSDLVIVLTVAIITPSDCFDFLARLRELNHDRDFTSEVHEAFNNLHVSTVSDRKLGHAVRNLGIITIPRLMRSFCGLSYMIWRTLNIHDIHRRYPRLAHPEVCYPSAAGVVKTEHWDKYQNTWTSWIDQVTGAEGLLMNDEEKWAHVYLLGMQLQKNQILFNHQISCHIGDSYMYTRTHGKDMLLGCKTSGFGFLAHRILVAFSNSILSLN
jgi:hypothetical protein